MFIKLPQDNMLTCDKHKFLNRTTRRRGSTTSEHEGHLTETYVFLFESTLFAARTFLRSRSYSRALRRPRRYWSGCPGGGCTQGNGNSSCDNEGPVRVQSFD